MSGWTILLIGVIAAGLIWHRRRWYAKNGERSRQAANGGGPDVVALGGPSWDSGYARHHDHHGGSDFGGHGGGDGAP